MIDALHSPTPQLAGTKIPTKGSRATRTSNLRRVEKYFVQGRFDGRTEEKFCKSE